MTAKCILAPITFAEESLQAAAVAADLATSLHAELVLAGIAPLALPDLVGPNGAGDAPVRRAEEQRLIDRLVAERLEQFVGALPAEIPVRTVVTWGPVGPALVETAGEERADLIVMPIRRERELMHLFHDHPDRYVLHHSEVPVVVVPTTIAGSHDEPRRGIAPAG